MVGGYAVAPSIVGVGDDLCPCRVIDRDDITLQILLEPEGIKYVLSHRARAVLHTHRRAV